MALRFCDSFDHYSSADIPKKYTANFSGSIGSTYGRFNKGLHFGTMSEYVTRGLDSQSTWIVGMALRVGSIASQRTLLGILNGSTAQIYLQIGADYRFRLYNGANTLLATSENTITTQTFYYIEIKVTVGATGSYELRVNGFSAGWMPHAVGQTRANSNPDTANTISLYGMYNTSTDIDDLYICDGTGTANNDFLGDVRIDAVMPTADDTPCEWLCSSGTSHFALIDEAAPNGDTDYIYSEVAGNQDTFQFAALPDLGNTPIKGVQMVSCARKDDASTKQMAQVARLGDVTQTGAAISLSDSYSYVRDVFPKDPEGNDWTVSSIQSARFGVKVVG